MATKKTPSKKAASQKAAPSGTKVYLCMEKCFFRNRLHYEGVFYKYPASVEMPMAKDGRTYFDEVVVPTVEKVEDGGLGEQVVNPAPDKRQPKVIDTSFEPEQIRPPRSQVKTGIKAPAPKEAESKE